MSHGDQASCPVVRARAGGGDACGLRPAHGPRAIGVAGVSPQEFPRRRRRSAAHRSRTTGAWPRQRRGSIPLCQAGRRRTGGHDGWLGRDRKLLEDEAKTANGEQFNPRELTAAHRTLPFGTRLRVTNVATGQSVSVKINDRGPFIAGRLVLHDLSSAAEVLGMVDRGITKVKLEVEK